MSEENSHGGPPEEASQGSVFGNLPASRPGTRSPRRAGAGAGARSKAKPRTAGSRPQPAAAKPAARARRPKPPPAPPPPARPEPEPELEPQDEGRGGLEDLAWAGVAAAAEAATLGVRIANRALESLRDAVDRR